jgi:hypothetical protein
MFKAPSEPEMRALSEIADHKVSIQKKTGLFISCLLAYLLSSLARIFMKSIVF